MPFATARMCFLRGENAVALSLPLLAMRIGRGRSAGFLAAEGAATSTGGGCLPGGPGWR